MKRLRFFLIVFVLTAATALPAQQPADTASGLDKLFEQWNTKNSPGCAVEVERDGRVVVSRAYGMADLEHDVSNTPETIFEAGSVSKQFTAGAVVLLALRGKLSLDDDVRKYVPEVPDYGVTITIRHLMTHTSGLRDWGEVAGISGWARTLRVHTHAHVLDIVSRQSRLNFPPGHEYSYCNTGFNLLAIIVGRVSGMPFPEFCKKEIFDPLGMTHTQWRDNFRRIVKNRAVAYRAVRGGGYEQDMPFENVFGNGGLLTTVGDLLLWTGNLETGKVGGKAFLETMHRRGRLSNGKEITYAKGLFISEYKGLPEVSHTGSTAGYRAFLGRYPKQHLVVALLSNAANVNPGRLGRQVADLYLGDAVHAPEPVTEAHLSEKEMKALAGLYRNTSGGEPLRILYEKGALRLERGGALIPVSSRELLTARGGRRLKFESMPGGDRLRIREKVESVEDAVYEPVAESAPTVVELAQYAGDYYSRDAETALTAAIEDGKLVLRRRPDARFPLTPVYRDVFQSRLGLIRFLRNAKNEISGLSLRQSRVYDMRFQRAVP